jgi:hypothetical protein
MPVIVTKKINHDIAAERDEKQQRGTRQRRAQPADQDSFYQAVSCLFNGTWIMHALTILARNTSHA